MVKVERSFQFYRTDALKKGVMNFGIKLYNKLPNKSKEVKKMLPTMCYIDP